MKVSGNVIIELTQDEANELARLLQSGDIDWDVYPSMSELETKLSEYTT